MAAPTQETLELMRLAQAENADASILLAKAWTQASGLVNYDLEAPSKKLFPVLTPLRNMLPRVKSNAGDTATRWKAVLSINAGNTFAGVSEGNRGAVITNTVTPFTAAYAGLGLEDSVSFEADYAGTGFEDTKATAALMLLNTLMIQEEYKLLGGNTSQALGTTPQPVGTPSATGGTIANGTTNSMICVALTLDGYRRAVLGATGITQTFTKTNADATTDTVNGGCARKSTAAAAVTTTGTGISSIAYTVTPVRGAYAYAWYFGTNTTLERLVAITTVAKYTVLADNAGTEQLASALAATDYSQNALDFDGILTFASVAANNGYYKALAAGATLTSDGAGGCAEISTACQSFYDNYRLSPTDIWVNSAQFIKLTSIIVANGGAPLVRYTEAPGGSHVITAGARVMEILNPITGEAISIHTHPYMPAGTLLFTTSMLPYQLADVPQPMRVKCRQEYYQIEWPRKTRKYEYGVYVDEVLQVYAPFSLGIITNIS